MFPISEYCCQNCVCKPFQSKVIGLSDSYHNLASPNKVKQNLWTLPPSGNAWVSIQSFVLRRCASTSLSGFPANLGSKWDQFNCDIVLGCTCGTDSCAGGTWGCVGGAGCCTGGAGGTAGGAWAAEGAGGAGGPLSAFLFTFYIGYYACSNQLKMTENKFSYMKPIKACPYKMWNNYK